jgi:hypothetical protein
MASLRTGKLCLKTLSVSQLTPVVQFAYQSPNDSISALCLSVTTPFMYFLAEFRIDPWPNPTSPATACTADGP